jgi:hypothetical protein
LSHSAQAKIVYTPIHRVIGPRSSLTLDLNHDGTTDFTLLETIFPIGSGTGQSNWIIAGKTEGLDDESSVEKSSASLTAQIAAPATLGILALGSPVLSVWRRRESGLETPVCHEKFPN